MKHLLILLLLLLPINAQAEPIEIEASGSLVWQQSDKTYRAIGDAVAVRGTLTVRADELTAHYDDSTGKNEIQSLVARGNVQINNNGSIATAPAARYDVVAGDMILQGANSNITGQNGDVITAEQEIQFNDKTGKAHAVGSAIITRVDRQLSAQRIDAQFMRDANNEWILQSAKTAGDVVITTGMNTASPSVARGNAGFYDATKNAAMLTGDVKITRGQNQLNGARAEIDMNTGQARLLPSPGQGRVRGLLYQK
jgi:lipopolysaccharide export system protein LptA